MRARGWIVGLALGCGLPSVFAFGQSLPSRAAGSWLVGFGGQLDESENESALATLNVGVGPATWLSFAAGRSRSPADRADVEADSVSIGVDQRFAQVGFTLEAERWGDSGVLETADFGGSVYFDRERWRIGLGYDTRDIEIPFTLTGPLSGTLQRKVNLSAETYSLDVRAGLGNAWNLYVGLAEYDYERDLAVLPRIDRFNLLSSSTLTLANSFIDHERSIALEREFPRLLLNLRFATDRSAVDGSKFETFDAALLFPVGGRVDLEVNVGSGRSEFFDSGLYGGLLVLIYSR